MVIITISQDPVIYSTLLDGLKEVRRDQKDQLFQ